jgi:hypothetical protein
MISPINNPIVLHGCNQIALGGQNNSQNQILLLLIYHIHRLNLNQTISYRENQIIFVRNKLLCPRCKVHSCKMDGDNEAQTLTTSQNCPTVPGSGTDWECCAKFRIY